MWYVWRSTGATRRKPDATGDGSAAERIYVSLGGGPQLVVPKGIHRWVPYAGNEYFELWETPGGWQLRTLDNIQYTFSSTASIVFPATNVSVLTEIRDLTGSDRVTLTYDIDSGCAGKPELNLGGLAYSHSASGTPLYEIKLNYERWGEGCWGIDTVHEQGLSFTRTRVLKSVFVNARNNLNPFASLRRIRSYELEYGLEQDTRKPRIANVLAHGEESSSVPPQPVATYGYGHVSSKDPEVDGGRLVTFGSWQLVPRPSEIVAEGYYNDIATSDVHSYTVVGSSLYPWVRANVDTTRARHLMRDFTGDGVADLLYYLEKKKKWVLYPSQIATHGVDFASLPDPHMWGGTEGPAEIHVQSTLRFTEETANHPQGRFAREALITTETWNQFIDWNGDGRLDVVDVKGGQSSNHWKVWLNEPSPTAPLQWRPIQVDIAPIRTALAARGLRRDDYSAQLPSQDWSDRLPLERTKSWPRSESYASGFARVVATDSITEWQLADVNEDGFPDFAANEKPAKYCESDGYRCRLDPATGLETCGQAHQEWISRKVNAQGACSVSEDSGRADYFLNTLGPYTGVAASPFSSVPHDAGAVVAQWTTGSDASEGIYPSSALADSGLSWAAGVLEDRFASGRLRSKFRQFSHDDPTSEFRTDRHAQCVGPDQEYRYFSTTQTLGEADLNGDGLADRINVETGTVAFNTGAGYGPTRKIRVPSDGMAISESSGNCTDDAHTKAGLTDLDGDGKPELLRVIDGHLYMSRLVAGESDNLHAAGRLTQIGNGRGGQLRLIYGNAKAEIITEHAVPFPEIVLRQSYSFTEDWSAPMSAPTHYAYGEARLSYDPLAGRWAFPGYRRTASITGGVLTATNISGVLVVSEARPAPPVGGTYVDHVTAHVPEKRSLYEGTFNIAGLDPYLNEPQPGAFSVATTEPYAQFLVPESIVTPTEHLECGDLDPATGTPFGYGRCRSAGIVYTKSSEAWEGLVAPPALSNVWAGTVVELVDMFGRPRRVHNIGDMRRNDDDVCTEIDYAVPVGGGPFPTVPAQIRQTDCGYGKVDEGAPPGTPSVIAGSRFEYDGLGAGTVGAGRLTRRLADRYDDNGYLDSYELERLTYDALGEIHTTSATRTLGSSATTTTTAQRDAFGATVTQVTEQASDAIAPLVRTATVSTWPSISASTTDANGISHVTDFDGLGRVVRERVTAALGADKSTLRRITYAADGRSVTAEVFPSNTTPGQEDGGVDRIRATTYLDAFLRPRFTQSLLGADYGGETTVSDYVEFDTLGRVVFAAHPFDSHDVPFVPGPSEFGVTSVWDLRGRLVRTVEAIGRDETSTQSSASSHRYVSSFQYAYLDGKARSIRRGPDENDPSSPRSMHWDESWRTASGREIERARYNSASSRLDLVRQTWDRLGRVTATSRFVDPATGFVPVSWSSRYDSLGRRLTLTEPGMATRHTQYDESGNEIESWWQDGVTRHITRNRYDGFGRATERRLIRSVSGTEQLQSHDRFHYDQHSGQSSNQEAGDFRGRLSWMETVGVGSVFRSYDEWGRMDATSYRFIDNDQLVREEGIYTASGRLTQLVLQTPTTLDAIGYDYDTAGRVRRVEDTLTGAPLWEAVWTDFDGFHRRIQLGNGVVEDFARNWIGRRELVERTAEIGASTYRFTYDSYDAAGRITSETNNLRGQEFRSYSFDSLGRLSNATQVSWGIPYNERFEYDALGNLRLRDTSTWFGWTYDHVYQTDTADPDRLCRYALVGTSGPCQFSYDGMGNVTAQLSSDGPAYDKYIAYDAASRITHIQRGSHGAILTYGPTGRVRTQVDGLDDRDYWAFGSLIEESRIGSTAIMARRIPGPQGVIATRRSNGTNETTVYTHGDGRGSHLFTDQTGTVVQNVNYGTFGAPSSLNLGTGGAMTTTDDLWNGGDYISELGVSLLGPRAYDPGMGRFLQRDPISLTGRATNANPYAFAFSDPINFTDPTGFSPEARGPSVDPFTALAVGAFVGGYRIAADHRGSGPRFAAGVHNAIVPLAGEAAFGGVRTCGTWCSVGQFGIGVGEGLAGLAALGYVGALHPGLGAFAVGYGWVDGVSDLRSDPSGHYKSLLCPNGSCARGAGRLTPGAVGSLLGGKFLPRAGAGKPAVVGTAPPEAVPAPPTRRLYSGVPGDDFVPHPSASEYVRPRNAGPTAAQRASVQGKPCVDCGDVTPKQIADHIDPLVVEHYRTGTIDVARQTSIEAVQPHCPYCSPRQGKQLAEFSIRMGRLLGFR